MKSNTLPAMIGLAISMVLWQSGSAHEGHDTAFGAPAHQNAGTIVVSPEGQESIGLKAEHGKTGSLSNSLHLTGRVEPSQDRSFDVNSPVGGVVKQVLVKVSDSVKIGEPLATIYSVEVANVLTRLLEERAQIKADIAVSNHELSLATSSYQREKMLFEEGIAAKKTYLAAKNAYDVASVRLQAVRSRLDLTTDAVRSATAIMGLPDKIFNQVIATNHVTAEVPFVSPVAGTVTFRDLTPGETVDTTKRVFSLVDLSEVWIVVDIFQEQIAQVAPGQTVRISTASGVSLEGKVTVIGTTVDANRRTLPVRIVADNPKQELKPGMFVTGDIEFAAMAKSGVIIPSGAVIEEDGKMLVFVQDEIVFRPVAVTIAARNKDFVEVNTGLTAEDLVVVSGARQLYAQSILAGQSPHEHSHDDDGGDAHVNPLQRQLPGIGIGLAIAAVIAVCWRFVKRT
jgi:cobalt-zinc-cadmium efflux system membrane fusion protein